MSDKDTLIYLCRIEKPDGPQDLFTPLPPDVMFKEGLAPEAIIGACLRSLREGERVTPENFARNRVFVDFMQQMIAHHAPDMPDFQEEASRQGDGWLYVIDQRTPNPQGAIPPQDILGGFAVKSGVIEPDSYQPNPNHRLLSEEGFFKLGPELHTILLEELKKRITKV